MKARDVFAAVFGRSGKRRGLTALGAVLAFALLALPAAASAACPNEAIREEQHATHLAECRAWEMVSPLEKGGGDIAGEGETNVASTDGNAITLASRTVFGDAVGSGQSGQTSYLARRGPGGWTTHGITPPSRPDALQTLLAGTKVELFSSDLSRALLWGYDLPGAIDDRPHRVNMYIEDTATGALRTVTPPELKPPVPAFLDFIDFIDPNIWGLSADARHMALVTRFAVLPEAVPDVENVYTWDDGTVHLAGILPDGNVPPEGSTVDPMNYRGAMSADGSRQIFLAAPSFGASRQLYLRIDASRTAWVSETENSGFSEEAQNVHFLGMTPDGMNVFFSTDSPLVAEDDNLGPDLYRWTDSADPAHDQNLKLISKSGSIGWVFGFGSPLVGMSDDGSRVYIHPASNDLSVWDDGVTKPISSVPSTSEPTEQLALDASRPGFGRVTPDGEWLAYIDGVDGNRAMFLYNLQNHTLKCVSCPPGGPTANVSVEPAVTNGLARALAANRPNYLSEGGKVFFSTADALVPQDVNGVNDTYSYDGPTGTLSLISSGKGSRPAMFTAASPSGDDVFFVTRQPLASPDSDELVDLYDARVGGGFPASPTPAAACSGDSCQGAHSTAPAADTPSSSNGGAGNLKHRRRVKHHCRKGSVHHRGHRCKKSKGKVKSKSRSATTDRRGAK